MKCILALVCIFASALAAVSGCHAEQPIQSDAFVDSAGVNIHLHYTDTLYYTNFPLIESALKGLGVRHVRDSLVDTTLQAYYDRHNQLGADGIHGLFITTVGQSGPLLQQWPSRVAGSFEGYEGPNEYDSSGGSAWAGTLQGFLPQLYSAARSGSAPTALVVGPSLTQTRSYAALSSVAATEDTGNMHNYHSGKNPGTAGWSGAGYSNYGSTSWNLQAETITSGAQRIWSTETGYSNDMMVQGAVSESVAALYVPRVYLMGWLYGSPRTYLYELLSSPGQDYGLLRSDGSAKPAYNAVSHLLNLLADPGPAFTVSPLSYTIAGGDATLRHLLLQKRDGSYYLALWLESAVYDDNARVPIVVAPQPVTIHVARPLQSATSYQLDSSGGMTTTQLAVPGDLSVTASSAVLVVELQANPGNFLSVQVPPGGGGTLSFSPTSPDGYYSPDQTVTVTAQPNSGYQFSGFTGNVVSPASPLTVSMATNQSLVATFGCGPVGQAPSVTPSVSALNVPQAAGTASLAVSTGANCGWTASGDSPWLTVSPATGTGGGTLAVSYSANSGVARTGQVLINNASVAVTQGTQQLVPISLTLETNWGTMDQNGVVTSHPLTHNATALINVDGTLVATPKTLNWYAGSVHTLAPVQPQFILGQPYVGYGWLPGGAGPAITVTAPTTATSYTQNMISSALLTTQVVGGGAIAVSPDPAATGGYYVLGQAVELIATPNDGCTFIGFTGSVVAKSPSVSIHVSRPQSVTATFTCP